MRTIIALLIFILALLLYQVMHFQSTPEYFSDNHNTCAVVALTRGYKDVSSYDALINRNRAIYEHVHMRDGFDVLVFHEGNITKEQQSYIQSMTEYMPITFVDIHDTKSAAFNMDVVPSTSQHTYETTLSKSFPIGYKHMCHFWFIDFLKCCSSYNYVVRIDEDCVVTHFPQDVVDDMNIKGVRFVTPSYNNGPDDADVTVGLNDLYNTLGTDLLPFKSLKLPYTNVFVIDVQFFLNHTLYNSFATIVDESGGIYVNRWGDLPLWGIVTNTLLTKQEYLLSKDIKYYHGSHHMHVN